jgi:hypothetical protein
MSPLSCSDGATRTRTLANYGAATSCAYGPKLNASVRQCELAIRFAVGNWQLDASDFCIDALTPSSVHVHFQDVPDMPRELLDNTTRIIPGDGVSPLFGCQVARPRPIHIVDGRVSTGSRVGP